MFSGINPWGVIILVLFFGVGSYILYLIIRALRKYISRGGR